MLRLQVFKASVLSGLQTSQWHPLWRIRSECAIGNFKIFSSVMQVKIIQFVWVCIINQTLWKHQVAEYFIVLLTSLCSARNNIFSCGLALHYPGFLLCVINLVPSLVCSTFGCWYTHLTAEIGFAPAQVLQGPATLKRRGLRTAGLAWMSCRTHLRFAIHFQSSCFTT